ncbi:amidohydrolase family protein [Aspergillus melleus]|uniref:amidohydrolase family protein n=1 Tax=Aspergillus melleus TaxID=138277 RepID=UPI001E8D90C1|nr:uncharacterized protein LDX57_010947 [Aspergillus melleus]KAH8433311.1 hypothetical protein LDX57_010947 [Aspergillus melleus]
MHRMILRVCSVLVFSTTLATAIGSNRIDNHFHALPPAYIAALNAAGGDPSGYPTPEWTVDAAIKSMNDVGSSVGILSISSPGVPVLGTGPEARGLARTLNEYLGNITAHGKVKDRLGFFGVLPDWQDVNGTLAELEYLYTEQRLCNGVTVFTTYGDKLLGDPLFAPIWAALQQFHALVFIHPAVLPVNPPFIASSLAQPIIDYPLATTRTAVDLVMTGTFRRCPDVDIILSHAGGAVPFVGTRAISSLAIPTIANEVEYSAIHAKEDFSRFYYDIAVSTSAAQLDGLLDFAESSHILFGSDFPYVPQLGISALVAEYAAFVASNPRGSDVGPDKLRANSLELLNKHAQKKSF